MKPWRMFQNLWSRTSNLTKNRYNKLTNFAVVTAKMSSKSSNESPLELRFFQFRRKNDPHLRLGIMSADSENFVELSEKSCISNNMIKFINQKIGITELRNRVQQLNTEKMSDNIELLPPVLNPEKIICIGPNYIGYCKEQKTDLPKEPIFFSKFASALIGPRDPIKAHTLTKKLDWEIELAVIIGKEARRVPKQQAMKYVFGYSVAQDISARDWQKERNGGQFLIGKSMDTFCPLGPALVHKSLIGDPHNLNLTCCVNGQLKQKANTRELIFRIDDIISRLSECITLKPGDIILTGCPAGVGLNRIPPEYLKPGDVVESEIQSLGKLVNPVVA